MRNRIRHILRESTSSRFLYHNTSKMNRESIRESGLLTQKDEMGTSGIYLTDRLAMTGRYYDTWKVNVTGLDLQKDPTTEPWREGELWYVCYSDIPPKRLTLIPAEEQI